jgi:hypothetical protein
MSSTVFGTFLKVMIGFAVFSVLIFFPIFSTHAEQPIDARAPDTFKDPSIKADGTLTKGFVPCSGTSCSACSIVVMINTIVKWIIGMTFLLFAILAVTAGWKLISSQGHAGALTEAKSQFTNAFIGLIIIFSAWLLIDTLLRNLLDGNTSTIKGYGPWSQIICSEQVKPGIEVGYYDGDDQISFEAAGGEEGGGVATGNNCPAATESSMVAIPSEMLSGGPEKIHPEVLARFKAMREEAAKSGVTLKISDGWRPEEEQVYLFNKYCPTGTCGKTKAAKPCSKGGNGSNHNSGKAVDIAVGCGNGNVSCNTRAYQWLKNNGGKFGFYNSLASDPPHWSPTGK